MKTEQLKKITEELDNKIQNFQEDKEGLLKYLEFQSKFYRGRSFHNSLLIFMFKDLCEYYWSNKELLKEIELKFKVGTDQTPFNYFMSGYKESMDFKLLPYEFNMVDLARKELLGEDLLFTKCGWIYQYNAIPNNKDNQLTNYYMKKTYEHFYGE